MHHRPRHRLRLALLGAAVLCAGCSSAVRAAPFDGAQDDPLCAEVAQRWPATVDGQPARVTAVETDVVAAWGDPAIIARCGAPLPGPTTDPCLDIDGVDWVAVRLGDGVRFTTYGRDPAIEVLVPDAHSTESLVMPAFTTTAEVIEQSLGSCT